MEHGQEADSQEDHWSLEDHEENLILRDRTIKTLLQLSNTVDRSDKDEERCSPHGVCEPVELLCSPQLDEANVLVGLWCLAKTPAKFTPQQHECTQSNDLEDDTSDHDVATHVRSIIVIGSCSETTTSALEHQRYKVGGHETNAVCSWSETGDVLAIGHDDAGETKIDGAGEKRGSDGQWDKVAGAY